MKNIKQLNQKLQRIKPLYITFQKQHTPSHIYCWDYQRENE